MKIKVIATAALAALFLASGIGLLRAEEPLRADEMAIPWMKAAFSAGYVHQAQEVCPQIKLSATLKVYIDTTVDFVAPDRDLWPYYERGKNHIKARFSRQVSVPPNKLDHALFCLGIRGEVEEIDKVVRGR